ncbi:DGQHR domain-containing protein [Rhodanobacter aciditrophus]|uniref:DGQHR domain-containing protein n=1 Tax=Rhodanobacter aciditrophus TaxID=1623218 RepID=UPI003CF693B9
MASTLKLHTKAQKSPVKKKRNKSSLSPHELEKRKFSRGIVGLFTRLSFRRIKTEGKEFTFLGRTGELDDIFVYENVVVVAEYTVGQPSTEHAAKKNLLWSRIVNNQQAWVSFLCDTFLQFADAFNEGDFDASEYRVRVCYFSKRTMSEEVVNCISDTRFLDLTTFRYFDALVKTIQKSARFEFFAFLGLAYTEIGDQIKDSSNETKAFRGFLLPANFSSFPPGFKVVSFYADPNTLLSMSYVLRRDSWRDPEGMYQRVLMRGRMTEMRKYLTSQERVFVNNIIVTLPGPTMINDLHVSGKNLTEDETKLVRPVTVAVPRASNVIGIVDGQHRVYCYHEGVDVYEAKIKKLRTRQNLLVTGIIYPDSYGEVERQRFEAKLFLEINDKQKKAKSDLKQSIELILSPCSNIAIAKRVIERLNAGGALKGMLQTNYFDPPTLIRTTSIVTYGLRPLVKVGSKDSLFEAWPDPNKHELLAKQQGGRAGANDDLLVDYVDFCVKSINALLLAARKALGSERWALADKPKDRHLTPTLINGFLVCMRLLISQKSLYSQSVYEARLAGFGSSNYKKYKSSHWSALGAKIFGDYF